MHARAADAALVTALAVMVTVVLAAPVLRSPSARLFGAELVGRHHDPFTVMRALTQPIGLSAYSQPITDVAGAMVARVTGAVAAYNLLVLISFPLTALTAYCLSRHLALSRTAAAGAALACAFSPFHLAHAAYHPHVAQVQWLPLYLLALWRCLDAATPAALATLGVATMAVTLSNFYGGLIAAVLTPVAVTAYWWQTHRTNPAAARHLLITVGGLLLLAGAGLAYTWWEIGALPVPGDAMTAPRTDLVRYGARWWSYLLPPAAHPVLGKAATRMWTAGGVNLGLLEQQVSIGWGVMALAAIAIAGWARTELPTGSLAHVPTLVLVAVAAAACSLSPDSTTGSWAWLSPSALLHDMLPMFRSFARFGVVVQLMAVLLAGLGVDLLRRSGRRGARLAIALAALAVAEYTVLPSALWRDVLPTAAHRWIALQESTVRALDCVAPGEESSSVEWLTDAKVKTLNHAISDCAEPNVADKLAAHEFTHLIVRHHAGAPGVVSDHGLPAGFRLAAAFIDSRVLAVSAAPPAIYTATMAGFSRRERDRDWSWQWMGSDAAWIVANTTPLLTVATLDIEVAAFHHDRTIAVMLGREEVQTFVATPARRRQRLGPLTFPRGAHRLSFRAIEPPTVADVVLHNRDQRPLSIAIGTWTWHVGEAAR